MKRKITILGLSVAATLAFSLAFTTVSAQDYALTAELVDTKFVTVETGAKADGDGRQGLSLTAQYNGGVATIKDELSGCFALDYRVYNDIDATHGLLQYRYVFTATDTDESFSLEVNAENGVRAYSVADENGYFTVNGNLSLCFQTKNCSSRSFAHCSF